MNKYYDYVIIGGGPTGLTLALYLSKYNKKVAIIEKEDQIGGCHSVKRVNGLFSEHGPRIYLNNYLVFDDILKKELHTSFQELFTKYKFGKTDIFNTVFKILSFRELFIFGLAFLNLNDNYKKLSFKEFLDYHQFSEKSKDILDRLGRLTDGGGIEKYTLFSFLQIMNQNILYDIYQPKKPNDNGLFKIWYNELIKRGVDIYLNSEVYEITSKNDLIKSVTTDNYVFNGNNFIFAIPPININKLFLNNNLSTGFKEDFDIWSENTNYNTYIPIVFHWNEKINIKKVWGYPQTSWGIGHIILSDYMNFDDNRSKTVISALITKPNKSEYINKTPDEVYDKGILIEEVFRQLKTVLPDLPPFTNVVMSQNYHDGEKWIPLHTAFMTTKFGYLDFNSKIFKNLFNCGVHNGKSSYSFTSLESAIVNAVELLYQLIPQTKNTIKIKEAFTLRFVLLIIFLILFILFLIFYTRK
jgi:hypothetical protein